MNAAPVQGSAPEVLLPPPSVSSMVLNLIGFQAGWFACVLSAAHGWPWIGTACAAAVVTFHLLRASRPAAESKLVAAAIAIGLLWDSTLAASGWLAFNSGTLVEGVAPHWILAMWALFATTLNISLTWLRGRPLLAAALGALAGPLSYWAGAKLGAVELINPAASLAALAAGWAAIMPALMVLARRYDGFRPARKARV